MKKSILFLVVVGGALTLAPAAFAGDSFHFSLGFGSGHHRRPRLQLGFGYSHSHARYRSIHRARRAPLVRHHAPVHIHRRVPCYVKRWVQPVYRTVVIGYDLHGRAMYRRHCVQNGYYTRVITGYRCVGCGVGL